MENLKISLECLAFTVFFLNSIKNYFEIIKDSQEIAKIAQSYCGPAFPSDILHEHRMPSKPESRHPYQVINIKSVHVLMCTAQWVFTVLKPAARFRTRA